MPYRNLSVITLLAVTFFLGAAQAQFRASLRGTVPRVPALGENANFEVRADVYNFFNKLNINPNSIDGFLGSVNPDGTLNGAPNADFGVAGSALGTA